MKKNIYILFLLLFASIQASLAQRQVIDRVVATVDRALSYSPTWICNILNG